MGDNTIAVNYEDIGPETFTIPVVVNGVNGIPACDLAIDSTELYYYLDSVRPANIAWYNYNLVTIGKEKSNGVYDVYTYELRNNKIKYRGHTMQDIGTITGSYIHHEAEMDASSSLEIYKRRSVCNTQTQYASNETLERFEREMGEKKTYIEKVFLLSGMLAVDPHKLFEGKASPKLVDALIQSTREVLSLPQDNNHADFGLESNGGLLANNVE